MTVSVGELQTVLLGCTFCQYPQFMGQALEVNIEEKAGLRYRSRWSSGRQFLESSGLETAVGAMENQGPRLEPKIPLQVDLQRSRSPCAGNQCSVEQIVETQVINRESSILGP